MNVLLIILAVVVFIVIIIKIAKKGERNDLVTPNGMLAVPDDIINIREGMFKEKQIKTLLIRDNVETIGDEAFADNLIESVGIGENVRSIGTRSFVGNQLKSIHFPDKLKSIGDAAFAKNQIKNLSIEHVEIISRGAFAENMISDLAIGLLSSSEVKVIGEGAFMKNKLTDLFVNAVSIESLAFAYNFIKEVHIGEKVNKIGGSAFFGNPIEKIIIGNNVEIDISAFLLGTTGNNIPVFNKGHNFFDFYNTNNKIAGLYTLNESGWKYDGE